MKKILMSFLLCLLSITLFACNNNSTIDCDNPGFIDEEECVVLDETAPVFTGVHNVNYTIGDTSPNYLDGISATDDVDGDITDNITVETIDVDLTTEGVYNVILNVEDSSGNTTQDQFTITVINGVPDYAALLTEDISSLDYPEVIEVLNDITILELPKYGTKGTRFSWTSNNPSIISSSGFVTNPNIGEDSVTVTLEATATNGTLSETTSFDILVKPYTEVDVSSSDMIPFKNLSDQYIPANQNSVEVFFVNEGSVPYMDIETYIAMLDGVIDSDAITLTPVDQDKLEISYHPILQNFFLFFSEPGSILDTYLGKDEQVIPEPEDTPVTALFDFTENTVTFSSYAFFTKLVTMKNPVESEGITVTDVDFDYGDPITINLSDYNIDILIHDTGLELLYLAPYHLIELFFTSASFYSTFYKPEGFFGEEVSWDASKEMIITSQYNDEPIPYDIRTMSFNIFVLSLDYFTSLKHYDNIESFQTLLSDKRESVITSSDSSYYVKYANILRELDDLKTIATAQGYYDDNPNGNLNPSVPRGPRVQKLYDDYANFFGEMSSKYGNMYMSSNIPQVRYLDDNKTAVMHFYKFDREMSDMFHERLESLPDNIENVVVDLSLNEGGNVGAVYRLFGYMTDDVLRMTMSNPTSNYHATYYISNSMPTYDYNWYIMSSPAGYNAGSVAPGVALDNNIATLIGQKGYGSTSLPDIVSLPCGLIYMILSYNSFHQITGDEINGYQYLPLQYGVEVEYPITNLTTDQEIIDVIQQHQLDNID